MSIEVVRTRSDSREGAALLNAYFAHLRRAMGDFDPARSVSADPEEMVPPRGSFLVLKEEGIALACGGLKTHAPGVGEIKRMYVAPEARGRGLGRLLLDALEAEARSLRMTRVVLDTRVPEAAAAAELYRSRGYADVAPFNDNPFANVWMEKRLA